MSKDDWFRRTTWSSEDREDFSARLSRVRGSKAQYLRIQALHLAEAGQYEAGIELIDRLLTEFPDQLELASAHLQKADALAKLGNTEAAIQEYRRALREEREFKNVQTNAWLNFGWLVVEKRLAEYYDEISQVLDEHRDVEGLTFPDIEYRYAAIRSLLADAAGNFEQAREFAKQALREIAKTHSGLRYHPLVGLVQKKSESIDARLMALARS